MEVTIQAYGIDVTDNIKRQTFEKLELALDLLERDVLCISLRLEDTNGPLLGGEDKACRITVQLHNQEPLVVDDIDGSVDIVIDRATDRLGVVACQRIDDLRREKRATRPRQNVEVFCSFSW